MMTTQRVSVEVSASLGHSFPALKHFRFYFEPKLEPGDLITVLKVMGRNLVTLLDNFKASEDTLPYEIWSLCLKLEWSGTSLCWLDNPYLPPSLRGLYLPILIIMERLLPEWLPIAASPTCD
jgi:hypothetical protein